MTGKINAASSQSMNFGKIKEYSKLKGITINDFVMSSLSTALHEYMNVKNENTTINIFLPANVRFKFYKTYEEVRLENKFSAIPIKVPLYSKMSDAYQNIKKITK